MADKCPNESLEASGGRGTALRSIGPSTPSLLSGGIAGSNWKKGHSDRKMSETATFERRGSGFLIVTAWSDGRCLETNLRRNKIAIRIQ
jgi:hypothetical protein